MDIDTIKTMADRNNRHERALKAILKRNRKWDCLYPCYTKKSIFSHANEQRLLLRFLALTPKAREYHAGLEARRLNWRNHVAKINALTAIYGDAATGRAIEDGLAFDAFSCEYITNLLEARARALPEASPLHLTRQTDWS